MKKSLLLLSLVVPLLGGCDVATQAVLKRVASNLKKSGNSLTSSPGNTAYIASLTPVKSGAGLIVFEPQTSKSSAQWGSLGAGCSRYLQVHVAGQGAFGKTPLWGQVDDLRKRFKYADLRLSVPQARQLAATVGVTQIAVGQLNGDATHLNLNYQLMDVSSGKVLATVQASAPAAQMNARLPVLTQQMSSKLGVIPNSMPLSLSISSDDLAFLGQLSRKHQFHAVMPAAEQARLKALAPKDALAGILAQRLADFPDGASWQKVAEDLLKTDPDNALVVGEISWLGAGRLASHQTQLTALTTKYPRNYLLCTAQTELEKDRGARALQLKWAEGAARANPGNPLAWIELAGSHASTAQDLRYARNANQISSAEWGVLDTIYAKAHAAAIKATQVDPQESFAWSELATDAEFDGDDGTANSALWKALQLNPANDEAYGWGFQMLQPKWGGNAASVLQLAQLAAQNADKTTINARSLVDAMDATGQQPALKTCLQTIITKDPGNVGALNQLAMIYHYKEQKYTSAEALYRRALKVDPTSGRANTSLGDILYFVHHDKKGAETLYRKAVQYEPNDGYFHANLGRCLAETGRRAAAIVEAKKAKALGYNDQIHPVWADTGINP